MPTDRSAREDPGDQQVPGVPEDQPLPSAQEHRARLEIRTVPALPVDHEVLERLLDRARKRHEGLSRLLLPAVLANLEAREDQALLYGRWDPAARALPEDQ